MDRRTRWMTVLLAAGGMSVLADSGAEKAADSQLQEVQWVIGQWKGVGQPRRGSSRGAWTEKSEWAWSFKKDLPTFAFASEKGKFFQGGELRFDPEKERYELLAREPENNEPIAFVGKMQPDGRLVLDRSAVAEGKPARVSLRQAAGGDRLVVLYERRVGNRYQRLAEVGYTRVGSGFGQGTSFVECVVTGGLGTIPVTHDGKTYYVCCTGCRDYFNDDPAGVLAEYRERKAEEARKKENKD